MNFKWFKGKGVGMKNIMDFIGRTNLILKADNPELKAKTLNNWEAYNAHSFPKLCIFVLSIRKHSNETCEVHYINKSGTQTFCAVVPSNFKVVEKDTPLLVKIMNKLTIMNLNKTIYRPGMTVGSDPEMFVEDENGKVIPAFQFLGGKDKPDKTAQGSYGNLPLYWDGFQAEFQTSAQGCLGWHTDSVHLGLKGLLIAAKKFNPKAKISSKTVVEIDRKLLEEGKEEHIQFGCMPSLNAYGMKGSTANGREVPFRPAGGHIHFGINAYAIKKYTDKDYIKMVKALDAILGVACVSLFANQDDPKRRELYGLAGEYRLPPHGLEYRVLSNAWLIHPMIMNMVFDIARVALTVGFQDLLVHWNTTEEETINCINKCNVRLARQILKRNEEMFLQLIKSAYKHFDDKQVKAVMKIFLRGMEYAVKDVSAISTNWNLETNDWAFHTNTDNKNTTVGMRTVITGKKVA